MMTGRSPFRFGLTVGALLVIGCERDAPPAPAAPGPSASVQVGNPVLPKELAQKPKTTEPAAAAPVAAPTAWSAPPSLPKDYAGTWFAVTSLGAGVYTEPSFEGGRKLGYLRHGSRVPVAESPVSKKNCSGGWYQLASGGYVCGNLGTTDLSHPEVKFSGATPNLEDVLPYPYARNAKNGTPLYKSVPSREQMERYEPYLVERTEAPDEGETKRASASLEAPRIKNEDAGTKALDLGAAMADGGLITAPASADPEPEKPWWQREDTKDRLHEIKLQELESDADDVLAKRMVTGFYIAVDKTFRWNGRSWYKTTRGLVAPTDRFWQTAGPKFKGQELDGVTWKLPIGWVYGGRKSVATYVIDVANNTIKSAKSYDRFAPLALTGKSTEFQKTEYRELSDGTWVKKSHIRITEPGPSPKDLAPAERWIDVNLSTQTVVAFAGDRPIYATLMASGKSSKIKEKDHRTPTGEWRIREKHITTTMDGDGTAAGDLPYSIEDVPYAMYYHRAYALHGAFWHNNFGVQMSHGCVNLAPLDAKYLFFFASPQIPAGFHGVWSNDAEPGSRIVIHE